MIPVIVVASVIVVAVIIARVAGRPGEPAEHRSSYVVPAHIERSHFPQPDTEWLVVVFTAQTCSTCAAMVDKAAALRSDSVAVVEVEETVDAELHRRYGVNAVPTIVIADTVGEVKQSFLGPATAADLWAAMAALREA